ncbi:transcriptional regulator [Spirosoma pomorum]
MNDYIKHINKDFESRARLGIMSVLLAADSADFSFLKQTLQLTDGNLSSHLRALEEGGYLQAEKQFIGRKPNTRYQATEQGTAAFRNHLDALERLILTNKSL